MSTGDPSEVPFDHFILLVEKLASVPIRAKGPHATTSVSPHDRQLKIIQAWISELRAAYQPLPSDTARIFFRLFFPEEDAARKYNMQEATLAKAICGVLGLDIQLSLRARRLRDWCTISDHYKEAKSGCLGDEVKAVFSEVSASSDPSHLTFKTVDGLLDELAATSPWSNLPSKAHRQRGRPRQLILKDLFHGASPSSAQVITQIILKDLRPVLYPLPDLHTTAALLQYNSASASVISAHDMMKEWSCEMPRLYKSRATFDEATRVVDCLDPTEHVMLFQPQLGIPVQIPKCAKAQGCSHAIKLMRKSKRVWVESKYDGERMQIHIDLDKPPQHQITIFSKSQRDSTLDRIATHPLILDAISTGSVRHSAILEGEMVPFNETTGKIDEFWHIRGLIDSSAFGVRRRRSETRTAQQRASQAETDSQEHRHLMVVFFDILYKDGSSLLQESYETRRSILEDAITPKLGYSCLSSRESIDLHREAESTEKLCNIFARHVASHKEGVVLKSGDAQYNDPRLPWVKLKRDYIPGCGDTVDLVIFGASWDKDRARELRVAPDTLTTFHAGLPIDGSQKRLHLQHLFTVSYGLDRKALEELNFYLKTAGMVALDTGSVCHLDSSDVAYLFKLGLKTSELPYTFSSPDKASQPRLLLQSPIVMELFGAGFTKSGLSDNYELRFPRITKYFRPTERNWKQAMNLTDFQRLAHRSVGNERPFKDVDDHVNGDWLKPCSPRVNDPETFKRRQEKWRVLLTRADSGVPPPKHQIENLSRGIMSPTTPKGTITACQPLRALVSVTNLQQLTTPKIPKPRQQSDVSSTTTPSPSLKRKRRHGSTTNTRVVKMKRVHGSGLINSPKTHNADCLLRRDANVRCGNEIRSEELVAVNSVTPMAYTAPSSINAGSSVTQIRFYAGAHVWIDSDLAAYFNSARIAALQVAATYSWLGAFFTSVGWVRSKSIADEPSAKKGVLFVGANQRSHILGILQSKILDLRSFANPCDVVVVSADLLPDTLWADEHIEGAIVWNSTKLL